MSQLNGQETELIEPQDEAVVNAFIQTQFINLFLQQNRRAQGGIAIAAAVIAGMWGDTGYASLAWAWFAAMLLVCALRFIGTKNWVLGAPSAKVPSRVAWALLPSALLMCVPLFWFDVFTDAERAAHSIIILAVGGAAVATTAGYRRLYLFTAGPLLFGLGLAWLAVWHLERAGLAEAGVGALVLVYLAFLVKLASDANKVFDESGRIRFKERVPNAKLKAALDTAAAASHVKTQFIAAASHDLRQPVHSLHVLLTALRLRPLDLRGQEILKSLDTLSAAMATQLDGFLDVAKLDSGKIQARPKPVALDQLLATCITEMGERALELGVALSMEGSANLIAFTDPVLLLRVLRNLIDNALKFTPEGAVTLSVAQAGSGALITVKDSGIGIAPEKQARVFDEFYQIASSDHSPPSSFGLGLSIVSRLCKLLNIKVQLTSELGRGTEVALILPLVH